MRKLAIVGNYPDNRHLVPFADEMTEIWVFNEMPQKDWIERWDACFQLHRPEVYTSEKNWVNDTHWEWLQQEHGKPIYMQAYDPRVPDCVEYPLDDVLAMIPYRYVRSSIAYALALAIYLDLYDEIGLYGINLVSNTEYTYQANNMAFWIGFAHGRGINLALHCWHDEFHQQRLYGYEGEPQLSKEYFAGRITDLSAANDNNQRQMSRLQTALDRAILEGKTDKAAALSLELEGAAMVAGETAGALSEAERYLNKTDEISRQEFERVSAQAQQDGDQLKGDMHHAAGKCEYVWNAWNISGSAQAKNQFRAFLKEKTDYAYRTGIKAGVFRENIEYMGEYDAVTTALVGHRQGLAV